MTTVSAPDYQPDEPQEAADDEFRPQCALCAEYLPYEGALCPCDPDFA